VDALAAAQAALTTPAPSTTASSSNADASTAGISTGILGGAAGGGLIIIVVVVLVLLKRRQTAAKQTRPSEVGFANPVDFYVSAGPLSSMGSMSSLLDPPPATQVGSLTSLYDEPAFTGKPETENPVFDSTENVAVVPEPAPAALPKQPSVKKAPEQVVAEAPSIKKPSAPAAQEPAAKKPSPLSKQPSVKKAQPPPKQASFTPGDGYLVQDDGPDEFGADGGYLVDAGAPALRGRLGSKSNIESTWNGDTGYMDVAADDD
jgi:hypothetical protein